MHQGEHFFRDQAQLRALLGGKPGLRGKFSGFLLRVDKALTGIVNSNDFGILGI